MNAERLAKKLRGHTGQRDALTAVALESPDLFLTRDVSAARDLRKALSVRDEAAGAFEEGYRSALADVIASFETRLSVELDRGMAREVARKHGGLLGALATGPKRPSELAESLHRDSASIARALTEVRAANLVEINPSPDRGDRRTRPHQLTLFGEKLVAELGLGRTDLPPETRSWVTCTIAVLCCVWAERKVSKDLLARLVANNLGSTDGVGSAVDRLIGIAESFGGLLLSDNLVLADPSPELSRELERQIETRHSSLPDFWQQLSGEVSKDSHYLVRAPSEARELWRRFFLSEPRVNGRVFFGQDLELQQLQVDSRDVIIYSSSALLKCDMKQVPNFPTLTSKARGRYYLADSAKRQVIADFKPLPVFSAANARPEIRA